MSVSPKMKIVFVHGWATDSSVWSNQLSYLGQYFQCECLNILGHNSQSGLECDGGIRSGHSTPILPNLLNRIKLAANGKRIMAVGWSLGAELLIDIAISSPEIFGGIVLIGATPSFVKREGFPWGKSALLLRQMQKKLADSFAMTLNHFYPQNFTRAELCEPGAEAFIRYYTKNCLNFHKGHLQSALSYLADIDFRMMIGQIRIPVLILHGDMDRVVPREAGKFLHEGIAGSDFKSFRKSGHVPFLTLSERVNMLIHDFILSVHPETLTDTNVVFNPESVNFVQDQENQGVVRRRTDVRLLSACDAQTGTSKPDD